MTLKQLLKKTKTDRATIILTVKNVDRDALQSFVDSLPEYDIRRNVFEREDGGTFTITISAK